MSNSTKFLVSTALLALGLPFQAQNPAQAQAQTQVADSSLETVIVSAFRGSDVQSLDLSATTLSPVQVQQAPETTVDQIVNKIPGVFTGQQPSAQLHPTGGEFNIRGFGTTTNVNTLVMVDGVPMNDPYFRTVDWSQLPKNSVDDIEVIRGGGATSLWGNMAMGGIVNVITQQPNPDNNNAQVSYGSFGTETADVAYSFEPTSDLKVGLYYDLANTNGYDQTPVQYRNPNMDATASQSNNLGLSAFFTPTDDSSYFLKVTDHWIEETGLVWKPTKNTWYTFRVSVGGTNKLSDQTSIAYDAWYGQNIMFTRNVSNPSYTIFTPTLGTPFISQTEDVHYKNFGGSLVVLSALDNIKDIKIGVDGRDISANDPLNLFAATGPTGAIDARATHQFEGIFAQGTLRPESMPVDVTLGLREDFWQTRNGSISGVFKGQSFANSLNNQNYTHFDPRLGAKYHLTDDWDVRAAAYENFAAPGMNQMYRAFIGGSSYTTSNPLLAPQTNQGEEIGIDYAPTEFSIAVTGYYNKLSKFIDYATVQSGCALVNNYCGTGIVGISGGSLHQYVNAGNALFRGFEVLGTWQILDNLEVNGGFTQTKAELISSNYSTASAGVIPDPVDMQIGQVPKWIATIGASWRATEDLRLTLQFKSFPSYWNNTSHTQLNDAASIVDIGTSYRINETFQLFGLIQNIGNQKYLDQGLALTITNGTTVNGTTIPALGMPLNATVGLRTAF